MSDTSRYLTEGAADAIARRFAGRAMPNSVGYATVRDYCDSLDLLPQITGRDGDLKNVQRPWAVKAVLAYVRPGGRVL